MRLLVFAAIVINTYSLAQSCVFDGKAMKSLGVSEVVNSEVLSLFRCSEGHQMWLTDEELVATTQEVSKVVKAKVPLSEMFGYVTQLRTITSGRATSSMEFSHYAEAPKNISEDVIAKSKGVVTA